MADPAPPPTAYRAWDPKAGTAKLLDPETLLKEFTAGRVQLVAQDTYPMVNADGDVRLVPSADVNAHLGGGYRFATQRQVTQARVANDPTAPAKAFAEGALNGALMGGGDAVNASAGGDPTLIAERARAHPVARGIGEGVGTVAGTAALGEFAPMAIGESIAARTMGEAALRPLGQLAVQAAGGAAEGVVRGAVGELGESALGRSDVTAESVLAHAGLGGVLGGAFGGAFGAFKGYRMAAADADALQAAASGEAAPTGYGSLRVRVMNRIRGALAERGGANRDFIERAYHPDPAVQQALFDDWTGRADLVKEGVGRLKGALGNVARELEAIAPPSRIAEPADAALADTMAAGTTMPGGAPAMTGHGTIPSDVRGPIAASRRALDELRADFARTPGPAEAPLGLADALDEGKLERFVSSVDRPSGDGRMERLRALIAAGREANGSAALNGHLDALEGAVTDVGNRIASANALSNQLSREFGGGGMGGLGRVLEAAGAGGAVFGHPAALGALALGAGIRDLTAPAQAFVARMQAKRVIDAVQSHISGAMESAFNGTAPVRRAFEAGLTPATTEMLEAKSTQARRDAYQRRQGELESLADPAALADASARATASLAAHLPDAAAVAQTRIAGIAQALFQAAPQPLVAANPLRGRLPGPAIPDSELRTFAEVDAALQDPLRIVDALAAGRMPNPRALAAVQSAYPALWGQVQESAALFMAGRIEDTKRAARPLDHARRTVLSLAFGLDAPALNPASLTLQQAANAPAMPAPSAPRGGRGRRPPPSPTQEAAGAMSRAYPTRLDRLLAK